MYRILFTLIISVYPAFFFGGFFDWGKEPLHESKKSKFDCPYDCGKWGSQSVRILEWEFVQCLYKAYEMTYFIEDNYLKRKSAYPFRVRYSADFIPDDIPNPFGSPLNFQSSWYQKILDEDTVTILCLSECSPDSHGCEYGKSALWKIKHFEDENNNHIGKEFVRVMWSEHENKKGIWHYVDREENTYRFANFIDFKNTCLQLEIDLLLEKEANRCRQYKYSPLFVKKIEDKFLEACQSIDEVRKSYHNIFINCADAHQSPSAFYNLALDEISQGKHEKSIDYFNCFLNKVDLDSLTKNLASEVYQSKGFVESEIALYDKAILSLTQAIQSNPNNKDAYFERAIAYFEKGEFDLSLQDFSNIEKDILDSSFDEDPYLRDYALGIVRGASKGLKDASLEFLPNICSSLRGAGNLLWTTIIDPIDSSKEFASAILKTCNFLRHSDKSELAEILVPEMYQLIAEWDSLDPKKRGELMGYSLGKYGTEILLPIAIIKGAKYVQAYNEIRKSEKLCTLNTLNKSSENRVAFEKAAENWNKQRLDWFEKVELQINRQNKHIPNKWNYEKGKGIWLLPEDKTRELLKKNAGKGQKLSGIPGEPGYRERVDFREVVGYYVDEKTAEQSSTTIGIIHYSKKGAHIVPARPK